MERKKSERKILNAEGIQGPMNQRSDLREAKHKCMTNTRKKLEKESLPKILPKNQRCKLYLLTMPALRRAMQRYCATTETTSRVARVYLFADVVI